MFSMLVFKFYLVYYGTRAICVRFSFNVVPKCRGKIYSIFPIYSSINKQHFSSHIKIRKYQRAYTNTTKLRERVLQSSFATCIVSIAYSSNSSLSVSFSNLWLGKKTHWVHVRLRYTVLAFLPEIGAICATFIRHLLLHDVDRS